MKRARFGIGTQFKRVGRKHAPLETVTDILTTFNSAGELVKIRYVATHETLGQAVTDSGVVDTTIARGLVAKVEP